MKVLVSNIPLNAYITGWVEIPDDTAENAMQSAIATSLAASGFKEVGKPDGHELDDGILDTWEFTVREVRR